jgi:hypothetical protein
MSAIFTIEEWVRGMVDYDLPDNTVKAKLYNRGIAEGTYMSDLEDTEGVKKRDLLLADIYYWVAGTSSVTSGEYESDGGWQHQKANKNVVDRKSLVLMADKIYAKYDEVSPNTNRGKMTFRDV